MAIVLTDFKYGKIFVSDKDIYIGPVLIHSGEYCDEEVHIFNQILQLYDTVIEVGANIGSLSIPISRIIGDGGTLYTIEPQQYIFNMLCANIAVNNISNIKPKLVAIGDTNKEIKMPVVNYEIANNFGGISINENCSGDTVNQHTLDSLFNDIERLKLIKIDVEGMESKVLNGGLNLIKKHRPYIYCENDRPDKTDELFKILTDLKYDIYEHVSHVFNTPNFKKNDTNLFGKNFVCINILAIPKELNITCALKLLN